MKPVEAGNSGLALLPSLALFGNYSGTGTCSARGMLKKQRTVRSAAFFFGELEANVGAPIAKRLVGGLLKVGVQ